MADSPSFLKWKWDASLGGFAIWQDGGFSIFFKMKVICKQWWLSHLRKCQILHFFQSKSQTQAMVALPSDLRASDKMADSPSFSKWKSDASHGGFAIWPQSIWQDGGFSIFFKVRVICKSNDGLAIWQMADSLRQDKILSQTRHLLLEELHVKKFSRILHSYPFARQQVWISQSGSVLKKRNFFLFHAHCLIWLPKSGRRTTFKKLMCKIEMFHQSRQSGKVGKEQTSRHLLPAWQSHIAMQEVISTFIARDGKIWQFLKI